MTNPSHSLLDYLRTMAGAWRDDPRDDAVLLARFAEGGDEAAFRVLVCRHGPLVWQTCRRVLGDTPDAEDAFQAAFLALVRKTGRFPVTSLAGWLHRVARQAAMDIHIGVRRRRGLEQRLRAAKQPAEEEGSASRSDLYAVLDEELAELPERLRVPLLLHYLEGRSQVEVARILGCARRALQKRLMQGEAILRERLERRGLAVGVGSIAVLLGSAVSAPAVPARLIGNTARAAVAFRSGALTGGAAEPARAVLGTLPSSSLGTMIMRKSLWIVLACSLGLGGAVLVAYRPLDAKPDEPGAAGPAAAQAPGQPGAGGMTTARVDRYGDPLPAGALARMGTVRQWYGRLTFPPTTVFAFSPDGKTLVSQNSERKDGSVCLWDVFTGREIRWIAKNPGADTARWWAENTLLALSPDGQMLAKVHSGAEGNDGTVYLWDTVTGKLLHQLKRAQQPKREACFRGITFLPNGKILTLDEAGGSSDNRIYLWDVATGGREISQLKDRNGSNVDFRTLAFSRDGKMVAATEGANPKTIQLWEVATGKRIHQLQLGKDASVCSVAFSPNSKTLAAGGNRGICVWEVATGKPIHQFKAGGSGFSCLLTYSPDGKTLLGGRGGHLWDVATGKEIRLFGWENAEVAVLSPNGKLVAVGDEVGVIRLWEVASGKEVLPHKGHHDRIHSIAYSLDGKTLASLSSDKTIRLWEVATGKEIRRILAEHANQRSGSLAYSPDGKMLVFLDDDVIRLWDTTTGKEIRQFKVLDKFKSIKQLYWVTFSPDGKLLASTVGSGADRSGDTVCLWQVASGKQIYTLAAGRPGGSWPVAFSPDGRTLAAPSDEGGTVDLWEVATGRSIRRLKLKEVRGSSRSVHSLAFSPDSRMLATFSEGVRGEGRGDGDVYLWEVATGKEIRQLSGVTGNWGVGWSLIFSPDGRMLVTTANHKGKNQIQLWEMATGKEIGQLSGHRSPIRCVTFSPDGKTLASCSDDLTCLVWDATSVGRLKPAAAHPLPTPARPLPAQALSKEQLEAVWADLAQDPPKAHTAIGALQARPAQAIPLLRTRLRPVATVTDPQQLQRWIVDLDASSFTTRDKAQQQIEKLGEPAIPVLRQALKGQPSLEMKRRLQALLAELDPKMVGDSPRRLREMRAVQVLEFVATAEAKQLLQALAKGTPGAHLTVEAETALARLAKRPAAGP